MELTEIVRKVLTEQKDSRDDDFLLIGYVYTTLCPYTRKLTFGQVMWNHIELNLPSFETIRRTRQKLQHDCPELRGECYEKRINKQTEYIDKFVVGGPL